MVLIQHALQFGVASAAKRFGVSRNTIYYYLNTYHYSNHNKQKQNRGRPRKWAVYDRETYLAECKEQKYKQTEIAYENKVHPSTVHSACKKARLTPWRNK